MLDQHDAKLLIETTWATIGCRVDLPEDLREYFAKDGALPIEYSDRRAHRRLYLRSRAVLFHEGERYCIYTKDISRSGLVFLHDRQLFPEDEVRICLGTGPQLTARIARCRRLQDHCYECGVCFL